VTSEMVVMVHGIWMKGTEMMVLRHRVAACGYPVRQFSYPSLKASPRENAEALNRFLQGLDAEVIHLVAHSLGGIVLLHLFDAFPEQKPGRVVMLGTPIRGSRVAQQMHASSWWRHLLGRSVERGLLGDAPRWRSARDLGMLAGTHSMGIGNLYTLGKLEKPNDGTVILANTCSSGIAAHQSVPYSHMGLLVARPVATAVCRFLRHGYF